MAHQKASEEQFSELHDMVTRELAQRIRSGEATTADIKASIEWLKANDITGVRYDGNPLDKLASIMPKVGPDLVQKRLYGKQHI